MCPPRYPQHLRPGWSRGDSTRVKGRYDLKRSAVALFAAGVSAVALIAGIGLYTRFEISGFFYALSIGSVGIALLVALTIAAIPAAAWSMPIRVATALFAVLLVVITVPLWALAILTPGCVCPESAAAPWFLNRQTMQALLAVGLIATPVSFLLLARVSRRRDDESPEQVLHTGS